MPLLTGITRRLHQVAVKMDDASRRRQLTREALRVYEAQPHPIKLHVGCGSIHLDGWVNTDWRPSPTADFAWNALDPYPLPAASCQFIFNEHFLEHFPVNVAARFLAECYRMLVPGGVVRIAMPSLQDILTRYSSPNWRDIYWMEWKEHQGIKTPCEMLNTAMRFWDHQWIYDHEELHRRFTDAGFKEVRDCTRGESMYAELRGLERREDSHLICEATR